MSYLFIILPYTSHLLAAFDFARKYQKRASQIVFTGKIHLKELVEAEGFIFEELVYIEENIITKRSVFFAYLVKSLLTTKQKVNRYKSFYKAKQHIDILLQKYKPKEVFIDEYIADYYFLLRKDISVTLINTRPSTKKVKGVPPLNSIFEPTNSVCSNLICEWLWTKHLIQRKTKEFIHFLAFVGVDETVFLSKIATKNEKNYFKEVANNHCLNKSIKNVMTYNLSPDFFEFPFRKQQQNEIFFFEKIVRNESQIFDEGYAKLLEHIQQKRMEGSKIVYVSFGTLSTTNLQEALTFFEKLNSVAKEIKNVELIISNKQFSPKNEAPNVQVFPFIPQVDFLKHVDLMINHGGIGSIKECLQADVKMLSYPLNPKTDQKGCAVRVQALGFGLKGDINRDGKEDIERKIKQLLSI